MSDPGKYTFTITRAGVKLDCTAILSGRIPADYDVEIISVKMATDSSTELLDFIESTMTTGAVTLYSVLEHEIRESINKKGSV